MTAPISRNNPTRLYKGTTNQIHTGEYRPYGMGSKGNIFIQNNYYGPQHARGWASNAWANMDNCHEDSGNSKFGEVLGWVGVGMSALGGVLDLFGVGKKSASAKGNEGGNDPGNSPATASQDAKAKARAEDQATQAGGDGDNTSKTGKGSIAQGTPAPDAGNSNEEVDAPGDSPSEAETNWDNQSVRIYDDSGKTKDINGKLKVTKQAQQGSKFPQEFQTTTAAGYTYKYENTGKTDSKGQPIYKCVSETVNGKTRQIASGNEYACQLDANGNPKFEFEQNQEVGNDGRGKGV